MKVFLPVLAPSHKTELFLKIKAFLFPKTITKETFFTETVDFGNTSM